MSASGPLTVPVNFSGVKRSSKIICLRSSDYGVAETNATRNHEVAFFFFFSLFFKGHTLEVYGRSLARGQIGAAAASLHHSHRHDGSLTH